MKQRFPKLQKAVSVSRNDSLGLAQAGLLKGFWPLDKNQHTSGTFETGSHLPKEFFPLPLVEGTYECPCTIPVVAYHRAC